MLPTIFIYLSEMHILPLNFQVSGHTPEEEFAFPSSFKKLTKGRNTIPEPRHQEEFIILLMLSVGKTHLSPRHVNRHKYRSKRITLKWNLQSIFSSLGTRKIPV